MSFVFLQIAIFNVATKDHDHFLFMLLREEWQTTRELRVEAAATTLRLLACIAALILQILVNILETFCYTAYDLSC